ncbi:sugar-binding protein [Gimibacter soli]|uniref:Sugar-binding protein n=1 Tax=Gimibacter soli TaxID=3024400 RepID=A0AAE9XMC4_9PROT|nr:sugar-binding protein [Gimibacter soli]WCL53479.1 sugar-binding protein [Gimibacter soli]
MRLKPFLAAGILGLPVLALDVHADDVIFADTAPVIDGAMDKIWSKTEWLPIDKHIAGAVPGESDFSGRYKLLWDSEYLYVIAEIVDDILYDGNADPRDRYWDDDCLEIFVDEDASGGNHLNDFNAFAYHIALDGNVVDIGRAFPSGGAAILLLNDHVRSEWTRQAEPPFKVIWEVAIKLFGKEFDPDRTDNIPVRLHEGKQVGFMVAYCDNDGSPEREHFLGSQSIAPVNGDKNLGYITASVFGRLRLVN